MAKVWVKFDTEKIIRRNHRLRDKTIHLLKSEVAKDTEKYVPLKEEYLRRSVDRSVKDSGNCLIYNAVYAAFMWSGKVMIGVKTHSPWAKKHEKKRVTNRALTYGQPGTGPEWFIISKRVNLQKWLTFAKRTWRNGH